MPPDAMHKRGLCRQAVSVCSLCVCVCVSVTLVHSVKMNKNIFNFLHRQVATPFYIFCYKWHDNIPTGTLVTGRRIQVG